MTRSATLASTKILMIGLWAAGGVQAQDAGELLSEEDLRLPIELQADSTEYDGKSSMLLFRNMRLVQGAINVQADEGRATRMNFEDSVWRFDGNVVINTENGHIASDSADLRFIDTQLLNATITGSPATFEMKRPGSEEVTYAEAGRVDYDLVGGIVEFSDNATITEAGNQISSNYLVYNITEQRINAQSAGADGERVKIIYTPNTEDDSPTIPADLLNEISGTETEDETDEDNTETDTESGTDGAGPP